ncbi:hypothetical protein [Streptomyces werraensis]|uniref:hypothetical protein n=1 Tax=Streptomyces werraensis TaxID=68284 RepID=UPI00382EABE8
MTLDDLTVSLRALRLLAVDFGHLPAPSVDVSPLYPEWLRLALHSTSGASLAAFEQWRTALRVGPDAVDCHVQSDGRTRVLRAEGQFAGAVVELTAYAEVSDVDRAPAGQAGGAR